MRASKNVVKGALVWSAVISIGHPHIQREPCHPRSLAAPICDALFEGGRFRPIEVFSKLWASQTVADDA